MNYADFKFPDGDVECRKVVPYQFKDADKALGYVKTFGTCVQAGGNVGVWADYLSDRFDRVYTFEPDVENFACLNENVKKSNVLRYQMGLGDVVSYIHMEGDRRNCGAIQAKSGGGIPCLPLDAFNLPECDFLQLDIEGMEYFALLGAQTTIKNHRPVIMIEEKGLSEDYGIPKGECKRFLESLGYQMVEEIHRDQIFAPGHF